MMIKLMICSILLSYEFVVKILFVMIGIVYGIEMLVGVGISFVVIIK